MKKKGGTTLISEQGMRLGTGNSKHLAWLHPKVQNSSVSLNLTVLSYMVWFLETSARSSAESPRAESTRSTGFLLSGFKLFSSVVDVPPHIGFHVSSSHFSSWDLLF